MLNTTILHSQSLGETTNGYQGLEGSLIMWDSSQQAERDLCLRFEMMIIQPGMVINRCHMLGGPGVH